MAIKCFVFDCDGVVFDSFDFAIKSVAQLLKKRHDICLEKDLWRMEKIKKLWGLPGTKIIADICPEEKDIHGFWEDWWKIERNNPNEIKLVPKIIETIENLKTHGFKTVMATNRNSRTLAPNAEKLGLDLKKCFDILQTYEGETNHGKIMPHFHHCHLKCPYKKPDVLALDDVFDQLKCLYNIKKEETIFLGDTMIDYITTFLSDIVFVGILNHGPAKGDQAYFSRHGISPKNLLNTTSEIINWIK